MRKVFVPVTRADEWSAILEAIRSDHYHLLGGRQDLSVGKFLHLLLKSPGGSLLTYEARVVRVTPGKGAALEVYALDEKKPQAWRAARAKAAEEAEPPIYADVPDETSPEDANARATAFGRVQGLSVTEKQRLAIQTNRAERAILVRDTMKQVHLFVFKNPRIQPEEVHDYAKYGGLSPQAIQFISENVRWMQSQQLRLTLIRNPQVPRELAQRLVDSLPPNDVRALAKSEGVRPDVRQAARKYLERKGLL